MISPRFVEHEELRLFYFFEAREEKRLKRALESNRKDLIDCELMPASPAAELYAELTLIDAVEQTEYFHLIPLGTQVCWADSTDTNYANLVGEIICDVAPLLPRAIDPNDDDFDEEFKRQDAARVAEELKKSPPMVAVRWINKEDYRIWRVARHLPNQLAELSDQEAITYARLFDLEGNRASHYDDPKETGDGC
jgi:hypothetical protein